MGGFFMVSVWELKPRGKWVQPQGKGERKRAGLLPKVSASAQNPATPTTKKSRSIGPVFYCAQQNNPV